MASGGAPSTRLCKPRSLLFVTTLVCLSSLLASASFGVAAGPLAGGTSVQAYAAQHSGQRVNVSASLKDSRSPRLAVSGSSIHVVWEEDSWVYHRCWDGHAWSPSERAAFGEQPALTADASGSVHLAFVNEFGGNFEVYHCRWKGTAWSLPRNVSNTSGVSSAPGLGVAPDGTIHVVWADNTPGYSVIYHAFWNGTYWINEPVPSALGGAPAVAVSTDGVVHVVWQDRDALGAPYEIYYSRWTGSRWSLPEDLSDTEATQSIIPAVAVGPDGQAHVAWQERVDRAYTINYTQGFVAYWSVPERLSEGDVEAYLPSLAIGAASIVYVGWDESTSANYRARGAEDLHWSPRTTVIDNAEGVSDFQLMVDAAGQVHAVWAQRMEDGSWDVFYQNLSYRSVLPIGAKGHHR
jgi:uncharacterized protein YfiM (DUF2279 family)